MNIRAAKLVQNLEFADYKHNKKSVCFVIQQTVAKIRPVI